VNLENIVVSREKRARTPFSLSVDKLCKEVALKIEILVTVTQ
jgi:hypothetical protein